MNTLQELKQANNIFLIDIVVSCDSSRKSYTHPIIDLPTCGVETKSLIYGTADEMNDLMRHFHTKGYHIRKNHCKTLQGDACYGVEKRRI